MKVIGIDPGTRIVGYGVIERNGAELKTLDYGAITPSVNLKLPERLRHIYSSLSEIFSIHHPNVMAVEEVFYSKNVQSAIRIGEGRAVAMLVAANNGIEVVEYSATHVKKASVGAGKAHKSQVQQMVKIILNLRAIPTPFDAADALAIAICHCNHIQM